MIQIFTTGGTIGGLTNDHDQETSITSLNKFLETANVSFPFAIEEVLQKDSRSITLKDREYLVERIRASKAQKILITHGTFTMEDTANHIGKLNLNKTIVLVGSFILGSSKNSDAPFNLGYAICALQFLQPEVYVAMNGDIFHCSNVRKNLKTNKFERKDEE